MKYARRYARIGAVLFGLWGLLHLAGSVAILAGLREGVEDGYAFYRNADGPFPAAAGAILGYASFSILWVGAMVVFVAVRLNWRNIRGGVFLNIALAGLSDLTLVLFLLIPGYVSLADATLGILLFALATVFVLLGREAISEGSMTNRAEAEN